jgi:hypothetical protein
MRATIIAAVLSLTSLARPQGLRRMMYGRGQGDRQNRAHQQRQKKTRAKRTELQAGPGGDQSGAEQRAGQTMCGGNGQAENRRQQDGQACAKTDGKKKSGRAGDVAGKNAGTGKALDESRG